MMSLIQQAAQKRVSSNAVSADVQWTRDFSQNTYDASIKAATGVRLTLACTLPGAPGPADMAGPSLSIEVPARFDVEVVRFVIDGRPYPVELVGGNTLFPRMMTTEQGVQLSAIVKALGSSRSSSFTVEWTRRGGRQDFSLAKAAEALKLPNNRQINECLEKGTTPTSAGNAGADLAALAITQHLYDVLKMPQVQAALREAYTPDVYANLANYSVGGPAERQGQYARGELCMARSCTWEMVYVVLSKDKVWLSFLKDGKPVIPGDPPADVRMLLSAAMEKTIAGRIPPAQSASTTTSKAPEWQDLKGDWVDVNSYSEVCKADGNEMAALIFAIYEGKPIVGFQMDTCQIAQIKKLSDTKSVVVGQCRGDEGRKQRVQFEVEMQADTLKVSKLTLSSSGGGTFKRCKAFPPR